MARVRARTIVFIVIRLIIVAPLFAALVHVVLLLHLRRSEPG